MMGPICRIGGGTRSSELLRRRLEEVQTVESLPVILLSHQQQEEEEEDLQLFTLTFSRETNQSRCFLCSAATEDADLNCESDSNLQRHK